jgi:hypothetical protein
VKKLVTALAIAFALVACGDGEKLSPLPVPGMDAGADGGDTPPPPAPDAGTVKRAVLDRNPFGGPSGNLLADGDFELSTVPHAGAQLGIRAYTSDGSGAVDLATETGGLCRSGLRCAVVQPATVLLLRGTAANGKGNVASGWVKVPAGSACNVVRPILITCDTFAVGKLLSAKKPDADGWCHYTATLTEQDQATCVYVDSTLPTGATALLDSFMLGPDDGTVQPLEAEFWVPDAETARRLDRLRAYAIATLPLGRRPRRPPPTP